MRKILFLVVLALVSLSLAGGTGEQKAARYFESVRNSPPQQLAFLLKMPKGGDLHNHLSGAIYAESMVQWASEKGLCVTSAMGLSQPPCDSIAHQVPVRTAFANSVLYRQLIDAWSMRSWHYSGQNGHDHFFDTFGKFGPATSGELGRMLAEVAARAAREHVSYLELMQTLDGGLSRQIGTRIGWDGNFESELGKLKAAGIGDAVKSGMEAARSAEAEKDSLLHCATPHPDSGCAVTIRYLYQVARELPPEQVFAQIATGFLLAEEPDSKVVGLNLVQAEDGVISMRDYDLHMRMLDFLRPLYAKAHISLHAGELTPGLVPPEGLSFHIRDAVLVGHAERIGHGVDILHERDPYGLMKEMAKRNVLVEICLTSNDVILGVVKENHPLKTYMQYHVPVALATDDEGVSRSEMSMEYLKASQEQGLGYLQLKAMARNSLEYSFLDLGEKERLMKKLDGDFREFESGF